MLRVLGCITQQHDLRLVLLAAVICLFSCATAMMMISRGAQSSGTTRTLWLVMGGVVAGGGIWSLHFVAMLAYHAGLPVAYDIGRTALSAVVAAVFSGVGFRLALTRVGPAVGGAIAGAAISMMHYMGMSAVRIPATAHWDPLYVGASLLIGIVLTSVGLHVALKGKGVRGYAIGAGLFLVAIVGMHFTAMTAVTYSYNPLIQVPEGILAPEALAVSIAAIAILILALGMGMAVVDRHLAARAEGEARRLRSYIAELEATKSELERSLEERAAALSKADAASRSKSAFLAAMSHELRTPLNAIIGFSEVMAFEAFGPLGNKQYQSYVRDIHDSGTHLLALIADILDLSRMEAGKTELNEEVVQVPAVVADCMRMVERQAERASLTLTQEIPPDLPRLFVDERRIKQVLLNLFSNAIKFTPAGGAVTVSAWLGADGLVISVSDTGVGIAPDDMARAFETFGQIDSMIARHHQGAGLGLPLARQLMELHGGSLELASVVSEGTVATIRFPVSRVLVRSRSVAAWS
jgi:signal transduction histidine kinase